MCSYASGQTSTDSRHLSLWEWGESLEEMQPLGSNPTLNQISAYENESTKALKEQHGRDPSGYDDYG